MRAQAIPEQFCKNCALIFNLFLQVKNQANQLNIKMKLSYQYFLIIKATIFDTRSGEAKVDQKSVPDPDRTSLSDSLCTFPCRNPAREQISDDPVRVRLPREAGLDIVQSS